MDKRISHSGPLLHAGLAALLAAGLAVATPALADEIKIGAVLPLTGDLQVYGETALSGINLAVDQVNAAGGVLGKQVRIAVGDTRATAQVAIDAAQKLVNIEGVAGLLGAMASGSTIPVAMSVSATVGVTQIAIGSTSPAITKLKDNDFLFRTAPSDAFGGVAMAEVARELGFTNLAIIYINDAYGRGLNDSFTKAFEKMGGKVSGSIPQEPAKASYRGELKKISGGGAEALIPIAHVDDAVVILKQSLEEGLFNKFFFGDLQAEEIIEQIGAKYLNGSHGVSPRALESNLSYKRFLEAYEKRYGKLPPTPYIDGAYDAAMTMMLAIEKAGSTDRTAIRDALREVSNGPGEKILPGEWAKAKRLIAAGKNIDYEGASGPVDYDADGDVAGTFADWVIEDGKYKTLRVFVPGGTS